MWEREAHKYWLVHDDLPRQHSFETTLRFTGGLSAVNVIGTQLRDPINSRLTRWHMAVLNKKMDAAAELGRNPVSKHQIQPEYGTEQSRLTRDGTAEPISRDQILRRERGQANRYGKTAHINLQHRNKCFHLLCAREDPKKMLCLRFLTAVMVHKKQTGVAELRPSLYHLRPSMPHRSRFLNN